MNKKIAVASSLLTVLIPLAVFSSPLEDMASLLPTSKKDAAMSLLALLPSEQRQGISDYLAVTGVVSHGGNNLGFQKFGGAILRKSPCVGELAGRFYGEINIADFFNPKNSVFKPSGLVGQASLANKPADLGLEPGWAWEKALTIARGNQQLALQLIGFCGHDDRGQLDYSYNGARFEISDETRDRLQKSAPFDRIRERTQQLANEVPKKKDMTRYASLSYSNVNEVVDFSKGVRCPKFSALFYPQALGEKYDIPSALKERIGKVQAPSKGLSVIPAKPYHIMAAAYSTCFLVKSGVPDFVSRRLVHTAVQSYRSTRLCENFRSDTQVPLGRKLSDLRNEVRSYRRDSNYCVVTKSGDKPCFFRPIDFLWARDVDMTDEIVDRKVDRFIAESDVIEMFKASTYFSEAGHCEGQQYGDAVTDFLKANLFSKNPNKDCGLSLQKERCENARKVIETYAVDFEWSEAQQMAGLEFAKDHCRSNKTDAKDLEPLACSIVKGQDSSSSQRSIQNRTQQLSQ